MAGARHVDGVEIVFLDQPIYMNTDQIEARRSTPMTQQAGLDVLDRQFLPQQRVCGEIDLPYVKIVGRSPPCIHPCQFVEAQGG
jgi:hypothetical protein